MDAHQPSWNDYQPLTIAGEGSYGKVYVCREKKTQNLVAIKKVDQDLLIKVNKIGAIHRERKILTEIEESPLAIQLLSTFKDEDYLYFVFEYCPYGTLVEVANGFENQILPQNIVKFYSA